MKTIFCLSILYFMISTSSAQSPAIVITTDKTISLIFPFPVRHVDRGTKDVLVQQLKEDDKILLVKAAVKDFQPTNLSVLTEDGTVYGLPVSYAPNPQYWIYHVPAQTRSSVETYSRSIVDNPKTMRGIMDQRWDMAGSVIGIYIKDKTIFYQLELDNKSPIDYDIDFVRFYIRDKKKNKRTTVQEIEMKPLHIAGNATQVRGYKKNIIVVALEKFTIPDQKYLAIEFHEKNGGRHLLMKVNNKKINKAKILPD